MSEFARASQSKADLAPARARTGEAPRHGADALSPLGVPGNQAMQRLLHGAIQAKLEVNQPNDEYEREADAAATRVMRMADESTPVADGASPSPPRVQRMSATARDALQRRPAQLDSHDEDAKRLHAEKEEAERKLKAHDVAKHGAPDAHKKKQDDVAKVRTKRAASQVPVVTSETESRIERQRGAGASLDRGTRQFFEQGFGRDLSHVRVHDDAQAARAARELGAHAFATDRDIFFASGRYEPSSASGKALLAHELAHTVQQAPGPSVESPRPTAPGAARASASRTPGRISRAPRSVARAAVASPTPQTRAPDGDKTRDTAAEMPAEEVALEKVGEFAPTPAVAEWLAGKHAAPVKVRFGKMARGIIKVSEHKGTYSAPLQAIELTHPALDPIKDAGFQPVLVVGITKQNQIHGYVSIQPKKGPFVSDVQALTHWIEKNGEAMGWHGLDQLKLPKPKNELVDGTLTLEVPQFAFKLGGFFAGTGRFGLANETFTFAASAVIKVPHVTETTIDVERAPDGKLSGNVDVPVAIANFSGNLKGTFANGGMNLEGMIAVRTEKMSGQVTLVMTDARVARDVANPLRTPDEIRDTQTETEGKPKAGKKAKPGDRALAGWGEIDAHLTEWLTGRVTVVVDSEGHITVTGKFAPPAEIVLFEQRNYHDPIFHVKIETVYGVPLVGDAGFFAAIGLDADAKLGPGKISNIVIEGEYSTDPAKPQNFSIEGTLNISGYAGLTLTAQGGVTVTIVKHDVEVGAELKAGAGIEGYVEATPKILYVETDDPEKGRKGEARLQGHLEMAAHPVLSLGGDLFVKLTTPWWSPISDHRWTWPLFELEYPVPSELGIGADIDYVLGSKELPDLKLGKVDFSADKFMTDLMGDKAAKKSTAAADKKKGTWKGVEPKVDEPPPVKSAVPKLPPAPPKAAAKKAELKLGKAKPATSKQPVPRKSGEPAGPEHVLKPEVQRRWQEGLQAVGNMEEASAKAPLTRKQLDALLEKIKQAYGFTALTPRTVGHDWKIIAAMNPTAESPGVVEGTTTTPTPPPHDPIRPTMGPPRLPTGRSEAEAIPMTWYKPFTDRWYPGEIHLPGLAATFHRESSPVAIPGVVPGEDFTIGVDEEFRPHVGKRFRKDPEPRDPSVVRRFTQVLRRYGYNPNLNGTQIDHVMDLAFGGHDVFHNLWPLDSSANTSAGARHGVAQHVDFTDERGAPQTDVPITDPRLVGRWFLIARWSY